MLHAGDHANGRRTEELVRLLQMVVKALPLYCCISPRSIFSTVAKGSWIDHFFRKVSNFLWHTSYWFPYGVV